MAEDNQEKSEAPTERKREDSRKEGQVAFSKELSATILLGGFLVLFYFMANPFIENFRDMMTSSFVNLSRQEISINWVGDLFGRSFRKVGSFLISVFVTTLVIGLLASVSQVGFFVTLKVLTPKFDKLNPIQGFGRFFSKQALAFSISSFAPTSL